MEAVASWDALWTIPPPAKLEKLKKLEKSDKSHGAGQAHRIKWFRYAWVATPQTRSPPVARIPRL
jgi:hypothetical protein